MKGTLPLPVWGCCRSSACRSAVDVGDTLVPLVAFASDTERICSPCVHHFDVHSCDRVSTFFSVLNKWPKHLEDQSCFLQKHTWGWPLLVSATDPIICARSNETDESGARIHSIIGRHRHCSCGG